MGGWVRNDSDGSVRARFDGGDVAMVAWCGPGAASVLQVEVGDVAPTYLTSFRID